MVDGLILSFCKQQRNKAAAAAGEGGRSWVRNSELGLIGLTTVHTVLPSTSTTYTEYKIRHVLLYPPKPAHQTRQITDRKNGWFRNRAESFIVCWLQNSYPISSHGGLCMYVL